MKTINQWWTERKEQAQENEIKSLRNEFAVSEQYGQIFLTHNGRAFAIMNKYATAEEIAIRLSEARRAALKLEGL